MRTLNSVIAYLLRMRFFQATLQRRSVPFKSARPSSRWQVWPLTVVMGVSRVRQTSTPKFIHGGQSTSYARTVSAVSKSPVGTVTTVQLASLSAYSRHIFGRGIPQKTYNSPDQPNFWKSNLPTAAITKIAISPQRFDRSLRNLVLWRKWVSYLLRSLKIWILKIQDGRQLAFWKPLHHPISANFWLILIKFGTVMHVGSQRLTWSSNF